MVASVREGDGGAGSGEVHARRGWAEKPPASAHQIQGTTHACPAQSHQAEVRLAAELWRLGQQWDVHEGCTQRTSRHQGVLSGH